MKQSKKYSRRDFLRMSSLGTTAFILAACATTPPTQTPTQTSASPTATLIPPTAAPTAEAEVVASDPQIVTPEEAAAAAEVIVGDVLDYALTSNEWPGAFGFVTFQLYEAFIDGDMAYHIRTDVSDASFAQETNLLHVPLLNALLSRDDITSPYYIFENGVDEQRPVLSNIPGMDDFSPAMHLHQVTFTGEATLLDSVEAIQAAEADGDITIETLNLIVNYPLVAWPGGALSVDETKEEYLGTGQLLSTPDTAGLQVTFKLHQCFPGSRYIVTDTSAAPMAPMMSISAASRTQAIVDARAFDNIWVFGNGIPGSGVMGFQPAIFGNRATEPAWSPFWNHFTLVWNDESTARVLHNAAEVQTAIDAGEVELFNGTPDSHPNGFVVNCPVPVIAPNTFST